MTRPRRQPSTGRRRRRTKTGADLSRDVYVLAAINLIEKRGAGVLSARTLGTAVGADPSALYRYFDGVDDVLRYVADHMIGIALDRWSPDDDWIASLAGLARALYRVYVLEFPRTGHTIAPRATGLPNEIRSVEITLGLLRRGGFDAANAARCFKSLSDFLLGQAMLDAAFVSLPADTATTDQDSWRDLTARLPAGAPHTEAAAPHLQSLMLESSFDATLMLILRGLDTMPRESDGRPASPSPVPRDG